MRAAIFDGALQSWHVPAAPSAQNGESQYNGISHAFVGSEGPVSRTYKEVRRKSVLVWRRARARCGRGPRCVAALRRRARVFFFLPPPGPCSLLHKTLKSVFLCTLQIPKYTPKLPNLHRRRRQRGPRYLWAVESSGGLERSDLKISRPLLAHELRDSHVMSNHGVSPPPRPSTGGMCSLLPDAMPDGSQTQ